MGLDRQGYLWLSNPWIAALTIVAAIAAVLWCRLSLAEGRLERHAAVRVRVPTTHRRPRRAPFHETSA